MNPQVALMVITTHGVVTSCTLSSREIVAIPPGLNIIDIQSTPVGIVNVMIKNDFKFMKDVIKNFTKLTRMIKKKRRSLDVDELNVDELIEECAVKMKEDLTEMSLEVQKTYVGHEDFQVADFTRSGHLYRIYDNTSILEKEFLVDIDNISPKDNRYNWKINLFLQDGSVVDLMNECFMARSTRRKAEGVKLSFILDCLRRKYSITNLIILDLSCNTMQDGDFYLKDKYGELLEDENGRVIEDPRAVRTFRRSFMKDISKGKTRKKLKKKTRRRSNKNV
jgi:hypothetical protein